MAKQKTQNKMTKIAKLQNIIESFAESFDGTKIWFKSEGKGTPIIFCNGLGCSTVYFHYMEEYFKKNYQVITFDYRGHGKSHPPLDTKNHTMDSLIEDTKAVLDTLKIKKAVLVGHSMGVQIIYGFHAKYPSQCLALIPCFGTYEKPMNTLLDSPASKYIYEAIYGLNLIFPRICNKIGIAMIKNPLRVKIGGMLNFVQPYFVDKAILEEYLDHLAEIDYKFFNKLTKNMQDHSVKDELHKIKIPTLIIAGEFDKLTPAWLSKKMHHLIPNSELFIVRKGSHVALIEQPELINFRIEKFLIKNKLNKLSVKKAKKTILKNT